jgi:hypothetical protein
MANCPQTHPSESVFSPYLKIFDELIGQEVTRVSFNKWSIHLLFEKGTELALDGDWTLEDSEEHAIDRNQGLDSRKAFDLWRLVAARVIAVEFSDGPLPAFSVVFGNGMRLTISNDDDNYEDWSLAAQGQEYNLVGFGPEVFNF